MKTNGRASIRKRAGLTQHRLAKLAGICASTISLGESRTRAPSGGGRTTRPRYRTGTQQSPSDIDRDGSSEGFGFA